VSKFYPEINSKGGLLSARWNILKLSLFHDFYVDFQRTRFLFWAQEKYAIKPQISMLKKSAKKQPTQYFVCGQQIKSPNRPIGKYTSAALIWDQQKSPDRLTPQQPHKTLRPSFDTQIPYPSPPPKSPLPSSVSAPTTP
jgi:hypothetical protein